MRFDDGAIWRKCERCKGQWKAVVVKPLLSSSRARLTFERERERWEIERLRVSSYARLERRREKLRRGVLSSLTLLNVFSVSLSLLLSLTMLTVSRSPPGSHLYPTLNSVMSTETTSVFGKPALLLCAPRTSEVRLLLSVQGLVPIRLLLDGTRWRTSACGISVTEGALRVRWRHCCALRLEREEERPEQVVGEGRA